MTGPLHSVPRPDPRRSPIHHSIAAVLIALAVAACTGPSGLGGGVIASDTSAGGGGGGMNY